LNKIFKGIRFRLTIVYSTLFGLFICGFAYFMSNQYFQSGRDDFDSGLVNYAIDLSEYLIIDHSGLKIDFKLPESEIKKAFPFILNQTFYAVRSYEGKTLAQSVNEFPFHEIPYFPNLPKSLDYTHRFVTFSHKDDTFRAVNLKITNEFGKEMILQVATPFGIVEERERNHLIVTFLVVPILILTSSLISFFIAGNALVPIKTLTDSANKIAAQNLSLRVPEVSTGDEVEELAKTLNNLLTRLETSFIAQENFVSNASHQLNTPLAIIKGELDVLESKGRSLEEYKRFQKSLREELERLIELVKNMLLVSRVESGQEKFVFHPLRLDDLLLTTTSRMQTKAREKKITIRFNIEEDLSLESLEVPGERQLLDSLFENILDNALKYSPSESKIELNLKIVDDHPEVWIQDEGPGFEEENFQTILKDRYHREPSISIQGTGIGLPIAHKIALFHNAEIFYRRLKPRGSLFIVRFAKITHPQPERI
jgi:signal transduction histidine kinase